MGLFAFSQHRVVGPIDKLPRTAPLTTKRRVFNGDAPQVRETFVLHKASRLWAYNPNTADSSAVFLYQFDMKLSPSATIGAKPDIGIPWMLSFLFCHQLEDGFSQPYLSYYIVHEYLADSVCRTVETQGNMRVILLIECVNHTIATHFSYLSSQAHVEVCGL